MLHKTLKMSVSELLLIIFLTHVIMRMLRRLDIEEFIKGVTGMYNKKAHHRRPTLYELHE